MMTNSQLPIPKASLTITSGILELNKSINRHCALNAELEALADLICGSQPKGDESRMGMEPAAVGAAVDLNRLVAIYQQRLDCMSETLTRLRTGIGADRLGRTDEAQS